MLFNIEEAGSRIAGWLVPDNPSATGSIIAVLGGRERHQILATTFRPDIKDHGLHKTGFCGFIVDNETCPGLRPDAQIELFDDHSNMLLFRRPPPGAAEIRLLHVETQTMPLFDIGLHVAPAVQMIYSSAEMIGEETLNNLLCLEFNSIVVSGAVILNKYEHAIEFRRWRSSILLAYPYRELAARLLRLKMLAGAAESWRRMGQGDLIEHFAPVDLTDPAALGRAFKRLSDDQFYALADPTTRLLIAKNKGEPVEPHQFGPALSRLAEFDLVGVDDRLDFFLDALDGLLGRPNLPREVPAENPQLTAVIAALDQCRPAQELVQLDTALYAEAKRAVEKAVAADYP